MNGAFEIEATFTNPVTLNDLARTPAVVHYALGLTLQPEPTVTIGIVFEENTDMPAAVQKVHDALTNIGLAGP